MGTKHNGTNIKIVKYLENCLQNKVTLFLHCGLFKKIFTYLLCLCERLWGEMEEGGSTNQRLWRSGDHWWELVLPYWVRFMELMQLISLEIKHLSLPCLAPDPTGYFRNILGIVYVQTVTKSCHDICQFKWSVYL